MLKASKNPFHPDIVTLLHYVQLLANSLTPNTVKNYLSGAKTFVQNSGGNTAVFSSHQLHSLMRGVTRLSTHVSTQAPYIEPHYIKLMCDFLWSLGPDARIARAAILFAYVTFLRQSNCLYTTTGLAHLITRDEVRPAPYGLAVSVRSTKTLSITGRTIIPIQRSLDSPYCPVAALLAARAATPAPPMAPLFISSTGRPLTPHGVTTLMRVALTALGHPAATSATVHSLRRSGARGVAGEGEDPDSVMAHGTWKGRSVFTYVPRELFTSVPKTMSKLLGP